MPSIETKIIQQCSAINHDISHPHIMVLSNTRNKIETVTYLLIQEITIILHVSLVLTLSPCIHLFSIFNYVQAASFSCGHFIILCVSLNIRMINHWIWAGHVARVGGEKYVQNFVRKPWEGLGKNGRVIRTWIFRKQGGRVWTEFIQFTMDCW